ncbi:MAG: hypothetical protein ACREF3_21075, partial [Acetobacteraceae bacterium]
IIASGIGRSGTSMIASLLAGLWILSADDAYSLTMDDKEFLHLFTFKNMEELDEAIKRRNRHSEVWAFKLPSIHGYMEPDNLRVFRNPRLVIVFRDPVAVAVRHATAEYVDPGVSLFETIEGMREMARFLQAAECPMLLVSYEKAIRHPEHLIGALAEFCGVAVDPGKRQQLHAVIRPDNAEYAANARRQYDGQIDGILDGRLHGWCHERDEPNAVDLELLVYGKPSMSFRADHARDDLRDAGIGDGAHGFSVDLGQVQMTPDSILAVRVAGRNFEIKGSGKPAHEYRR